MTVEMIWKKIPISESEVCLSRVLRCGQTFRWKNINNIWSFAIRDRIILLQQDHENLYYSHILRVDKRGTDKETFSFLNDYFTLDVKLEELYNSWKQSHSKYITVKQAEAASPFDLFTGIRILRQDPWECLISFICSSNNNVKRISKMCDNLCIHFGNFINEHQGHKYYSFPTAEQLSKEGVESKLRDLGFGYRAKYIYQTAKKFTSAEFPDITIENLEKQRDSLYEQAHEFLLQLSGVGPKVADCICLMALDKWDVVPIDTHVYQIAIRDFKYKGKKDLKTLNKEMHQSIRSFFKNIFGEYAGWAQSVLFAADLSDLNNGTNIVEAKVEVDGELSRKRIEDKVDKVTVKTIKKVKLNSTIKVES
ncbi:OGG1 [Candida oxycetoniae]|uniref:N-glycosylase/DNA lyase n=1 Tax=Candida oxycetoniae TaxID=497107 RepID=A0AAI9T0G1_9ASCO|nr:OGG1 [Candida oxycetoniae]KAI3406513.1 OGG1 [Candida oxycetoniae]